MRISSQAHGMIMRNPRRCVKKFPVVILDVDEDSSRLEKSSRIAVNDSSVDWTLDPTTLQHMQQPERIASLAAEPWNSPTNTPVPRERKSKVFLLQCLIEYERIKVSLNRCRGRYIKDWRRSKIISSLRLCSISTGSRSKPRPGFSFPNLV